MRNSVLISQILVNQLFAFKAPANDRDGWADPRPMERCLQIYEVAAMSGPAAIGIPIQAVPRVGFGSGRLNRVHRGWLAYR